MFRETAMQTRFAAILLMSTRDTYAMPTTLNRRLAHR